MYFYPNRRKFLSAFVKTPLALSTVLGARQVFSEDAQTLNDHQRATLQHLCYVLYPFPEVGDTPYRRAIDAFEIELQRQPQKMQLILAGINQLDKHSSTKWINLPEQKQVELLKMIETEEFFTTVLAFVNSHIFNDNKIWDFIGYEGSSLEKGGYLDRGFNDIDWL